MVTGHRAALAAIQAKKQDPEKTGTQTGVLSPRSTKGNLSQEMLQHAQDTGTPSPETHLALWTPAVPHPNGSPRPGGAQHQ